uniref:Uncharacterized protein n=1 Tax=Nelumbo nucifera TaxID=4432 RepID=A0A822ZH74_NELNU|nr:TPA_asm: hypothetical protein HUJ06_002477 [Nelumbo nucifera]
MATLSQNSSHRSVAMVLSLVSAVVLSPLYLKRKTNDNRNETRWNSGFVLPMILAGLIISIRVASSSSSSAQSGRSAVFSSMDASCVLRIGNSSWGLTGVLILLMIVLSWQDSVQGFFWK